MIENRGRKYHQGRVAEALREEITTLVEGELGDPRILAVSVSEVHLTPDGRTAIIFVVVAGDDLQTRRSMEGLMKAKGYIRREVAERLGLRHPPELVFELDRSDEHGARIEELLGRIQKRKQREARGRG